MKIQILFWNVQGAASKGFRRSFNTLIKNYGPFMVIIMELRISGKQADDFIKCSGFEYSHRIEASGFSGGIWILWQGYYEVEVSFNHKQFVHFKISKDNILKSWITAVYACPNPSL